MAQVDRCHLRHGQNLTTRMLRDEQSNFNRYSGAIDQIVRWKLDATTTTGGRSSMDRHHHHQEEGENTPIRRSILDCISSVAAADSLRSDSGLEGNGGANILTGSQNLSTPNVPVEIECFDDAAISAACMLLEMKSVEMNTTDMCTSLLSHAADEYRKEEQRSIIRISDFHDHAASATPPFYELSEMVGTKNSGCSRATDDEVGTAQERRTTWATYNSSTLLRTLGKKRVKPREDDREFNVLGMNQELFTTNKYDILSRPPRKRNYKSLSELLGIK